MLQAPILPAAQIHAQQKKLRYLRLSAWLTGTTILVSTVVFSSALSLNPSLYQDEIAKAALIGITTAMEGIAILIDSAAKRLYPRKLTQFYNDHRRHFPSGSQFIDSQQNIKKLNGYQIALFATGSLLMCGDTIPNTTTTMGFAFACLLMTGSAIKTASIMVGIYAIQAPCKVMKDELEQASLRTPARYV